MTSNRLFALHLQRLQHLKSNFVELGEATFSGSVLRSKCGFPVLSLEGNDKIRGRLHEFDLTQVQLSFLDEMMGYNPQNEAASVQIRSLIQVNYEGQIIEAWSYVLNSRRQPLDMTPICEGDWQQSLAAHPPLTEKLTDKQKSYIKKLGVSVGRDVLPINLALYRELMNLELIVDKGRRLALSKFGQEVFSYLE